MRCTRLVVLAAMLLPGCAFIGGDNEPIIADLGHEAVQLEDVPYDVSERQAMSAYREFLATPDETDARPQAMRRLADISLEAEVIPQADFDSEQTVSLYPQQVEDSISLYSKLLQNYPERTGNDAVMYQLARAYELGGEPDRSLDMLARLIREYPDSPRWLEARFRRGEILFVQKQYRAAENAYQAVVDAGNNNPYYPHSLYKLGWSHFKQGMFTEALDAFTALLDAKLDSGLQGAARLETLARAERERVDDTLRVISLSFAYEQGPASIAGYFSTHGSRHYEDILYDRLGAMYLDKERYNDAAGTFQAFVDQNPLHASAPAFQMRVIDTWRKAGFPTLVLQGKKDFVNRYNLQADYWQQHDPAGNAAKPVMDFLKLTMTDLSRHYHALAQKHKKPEQYAEAAHWYRSYIGSFPDDSETPNMNFLLAELLFESGRYSAAADEYVRTAYEYGEHEKAAEAGYASVLARSKQEALLDGESRRQWHAASIEYALRFTTSFPQHPQALAVLVKSSEQLLALGDNLRAIEVAQHAIDSAAASTDQQRVVWTVQAHAWFDLDDYLHAEQAYQQVLQRTAADDANKPAIIERLAASIYKQGEAAQAAGETRAAVEHFGRVRRITPTASIVATADYDAAAGLMQLQDWNAAAGALEAFRNAYPDDDRQAEVTRRLATAYLSANRPQQAAQEFERIGRNHADSDLRRDALWQSAELYAEAGSSRQALGVYEEYIRQFPQPVEAAVEARHRIATYYRQDGDTTQYHHWLEEIITADRKAGRNRTERTRYLAANAMLSLAEVRFSQYSTSRLVLPLKQSLEAKKRLMQRALESYEQAAAYEVALVTTASAYRTAQVYAQMGQALMESQRPENLDAEALEQYDILLEDQAYPFEEQAIELHQANTARIESGYYDAWIEKSLRALARLVPAQYAKQERGANHVTALR